MFHRHRMSLTGFEPRSSSCLSDDRYANQATTTARLIGLLFCVFPSNWVRIPMTVLCFSFKMVRCIYDYYASIYSPGIRYVNRNSIQTILWQNKSFTTLNPSPALDGNEMEGARLRSALTKMKFELGLSLLAISLRCLWFVFHKFLTQSTFSLPHAFSHVVNKQTKQ